MMTILIVVQVLLAIAMTGMILVQRGKGAAAGSAFGGGASGTVFGSQGSASFLSRTTAVLATAFFVVSLAMAVIAGRTVNPAEQAPDLGVMGGAEPAAQPSDVPVLDGADPLVVPPAEDAELPDLGIDETGIDSATPLEAAESAVEGAMEEATETAPPPETGEDDDK